MNSLPGTIAPDGELCRVSDLRRALPPCISRPDLKIKIPLIPPARSNDRYTAFVRGIFSALTRRDHANLRSRAGLSIKRVWGGESLNCARLSTNRRTAYCSCAPMRKCENRHHSRNKERCRKASYGQLRATRSHRRALRVRCRAPRLPPPRGPRANGIPM